MLSRWRIKALFVAVCSMVAIWQLHAAEYADCVWTCTARTYCVTGPSTVRCPGTTLCRTAWLGSCVGQNIWINPGGVTIDAAIQGGSKETTAPTSVVCFASQNCGDTGYFPMLRCAPIVVGGFLVPCSPGWVLDECYSCGLIGVPVDYNVDHFVCSTCTPDA